MSDKKEPTQPPRPDWRNEGSELYLGHAWVASFRSTSLAYQVAEMLRAARVVEEYAGD